MGSLSLSVLLIITLISIVKSDCILSGSICTSQAPVFCNSNNHSSILNLCLSINGDLIINQCKPTCAIGQGVEKLSNLEQVTGNIDVSQNQDVVSVAGFTKLYSVGGYLRISKNTALTSVHALSNINRIGTYLSITDNYLLPTINGLEQLVTVGDYFRLENLLINNISPLFSLKNVTSSLILKNLTNVENLSGLGSLINLGSLEIINNPIMKSFFGIGQVQTLDSLIVQGNPMIQSISIATLKSVKNVVLSQVSLVPCYEIVYIRNITIESFTYSGPCNVTNITFITIQAPTPTPTPTFSTPSPTRPSNLALKVAVPVVVISLILTLSVVGLIVLKKQKTSPAAAATSKPSQDDEPKYFQIAYNTVQQKGPASVFVADAAGLAMIHYASLLGDVAAITFLLEVMGTHNIDFEDLNQRTALMWASKMGKSNAVALIIKLGGSIKKTDSSGLNALHHACENHHLEVIHMLLQKGASLSSVDHLGRTPFYLACLTAKDTRILEYLVHAGAPINQPDFENNSPLMNSIKHNSRMVFDFLIKNRVSTGGSNNRGYTCLHWAAFTGDMYFVKNLIPKSKKSLELDSETLQGETPLILACKEGHLEVVQFLVSCNCKFSQDNFGKSPTDWALSKNHMQIYNFLTSSEKGFQQGKKKRKAKDSNPKDKNQVPLEEARSSNDTPSSDSPPTQPTSNNTGFSSSSPSTPGTPDPFSFTDDMGPVTFVQDPNPHVFLDSEIIY